MSEKKHFLSPKLTGKRFDEHSVPIEILQDFAALQELIVDLAKKIYLDENPTRKRVPKGFTDGVTLNLQQIEEGSAVLNFLLGTALISSPILGEDSHAYTYFEKAKNKVIEVVAVAEKDGNVRDILSIKHLNYFNRIGRSLKEDEVVIFNPNASSGIAKLNKRTRNKIVQSLSADASYTDKFNLVAPIASIDRTDKQFSVLVNGQKIPAKLDYSNYKLVVTTFTEYYSTPYVAIEGEGVYDRNGKLTKINSITTMDILDPLDVSLRITELSELKDGWYNSIGVAPDKVGLIKFEQLFKQHYPESLVLPTIFPTVSGNIQLEWSLPDNEISLEVQLTTLSAELVSVSISTDFVKEEILDLNDLNSWKILTKILS